MFDTGLSFNQLITGKKELEEMKWCFFTDNWIFHNHACAYVDYNGRDRVLESKAKEIEDIPTKVKEYFKGLITRYKPVLNHKSKTINQKEIKNKEKKYVFEGNIAKEV